MDTRDDYKWTLRILGWIVGLVFLYAAVSKIVVIPLEWTGSGFKWKTPQDGWLEPTQKFAKNIHNYHILSPAPPATDADSSAAKIETPTTMPERVLAIIMPWIEIVAALALMTRRFRYEGAVTIGGLLVIFLVAISWALSKGYDISCGCFGDGKKIGWQTLTLDGALLVMIIVVIGLLERQRRKTAALKSE